MSPLRIIIIAILIYIGYRLITSTTKKKVSPSSKTNEQEKYVQNDTLEEDPVCRKLVPRQQAVQLELNGKTHYFCSDKCRKIYRKNQGE